MSMRFSEVSSIYLIDRECSCRGKGRVEIAYYLRWIYSHVRVLGLLSSLLSLFSLPWSFSQTDHGSGPHASLLRHQRLPLWCHSRASPANPTLPMEVSNAWNWGCPGTPRLPYSVLWDSSCSMPSCKRETMVTDSPATSTPDPREQQAEKWHRSGLIQMNWIP